MWAGGTQSREAVEAMHAKMCAAIPSLDADRSLFSRRRRSGRALRLPQAKARDASARRRSSGHRFAPKLPDWRSLARRRLRPRRRLPRGFHRSRLPRGAAGKARVYRLKFERRGQRHPARLARKTACRGQRVGTSVEPHGLPGAPRFADQDFRRRRGPAKASPLFIASPTSRASRPIPR